MHCLSQQRLCLRTATDDADAKPLAKAPSRLSFSGMNPFGRRKSEELKTPPDVDA